MNIALADLHSTNPIYSGTMAFTLDAFCCQLLGRSSTPTFCCDIEGSIVFRNGAAARLLGEEPTMHLPGIWCGSATFSLRDGAPLDGSKWPPLAAISSGNDIHGMELDMMTRLGNLRHVLLDALLIRGQGGGFNAVMCMILDVTDRVDMEKRLQGADQNRSEFISMLAHEIRNPLSPIMSGATFLLQTCGDSSIGRIASIVERQAKQLSRFVNDLLDSRALGSSGTMLINKRATTVDEVIERALDVVMERMEARCQHLEVRLDALTAGLFCDLDRVSQAIGNVLLNASEFTSDRGTIEIHVNSSDDFLNIDILDDGIGMKQDRSALIFDSFAQSGTHPKRMRSGAGLGLAIAREVCERHGGAIYAQSLGLGCGSAFRLKLPILTP